MLRVVSPGPALDVTHLVERVVPGGITRPREVLRLPGGKGLNLARAARTLGGAARVIAPLGGGIGAIVADLARAEGLALDALPIAAETRLCVSALPDAGEPTELYEPTTPLESAEAEALVDAIPLPGSSWVAICGRLPGSLPVDRLARVLAEAQGAGTRVAVDTSGPGLRELLGRVRPDLVKVNRAEAGELLDLPDADAAVLAAGIHALTGRTAVVTDAAEGAAGVDGEGAWRADPDPAPGRYGIGSGDSFLAGFLTASEHGQPLQGALLAASAAGSANTRVPGAGRFPPAEVSASWARIRVARA